MTRRRALAIVLAAAVVPRLVVLLSEREAILEELVEKSDRFAQTLVASGTFGFLPGRPSGYTQPLYAWFLAGLYQVLERHWLVVGIAHIALAALTAVIVLEIGRRAVSLRVGVVGATIATLHPFLVWHDMHLNREVLDGLLVAVVALLALVVAERKGALLALALGAAAGFAILGNARLVLLPLILAAFVALPLERSRRSLLLGAAVLAGSAVVVTPWIARNEISIGCPVLTTDTRALWKANNENTREILDRGGWIDDVPEPRGGPPWPELAADLTLAGRPTEVDECAQQRYYRELVLDFWRENPDEKGRLAAQAVQMLWSPTFSVDSDDAGRGRLAELGRDVVEPVFMLAVYLLAIVGAVLAPRRYVALVVSARGLQHARRHGLCRNGALPSAFRLPARDPRRRRARARLGLATGATPADGYQRMKVLHIQRIGGIGGSERHVLELVPALRARGIDARFLGLDDTSASPQPFYDALSEREVPFERLPCPRDLDPRLAAGVIRATRASRPDIVHTHLIHADAYGALASALARTHSRLDETQRRSLPLRHRSLSGAAADEARVSRHLHHRGAGPLQPRGRRAPRSKAPGRALRPGRAARAVGSARRPGSARGDAGAGGDLPARSAKGSRRRNRRTPAHSGEAPGSSPRRARRGGTATRAHRPGSQARRRGRSQLPGRVGDVAWWLRRAAVVVHPARWEGFGLALLEAMLCERPIVASNVSSIPEIVLDGETGVLVPPDDSARLAEAVVSLLDDPARARALGEAGGRRAREEFSVAQMAERTAAVYEEALSSSRR